MPNTITCSNGEVEFQFHEVDTYEDWIAGCKANHPSGVLNKKGDPGTSLDTGKTMIRNGSSIRKTLICKPISSVAGLSLISSAGSLVSEHRSS